jgi:ATP-dependent Zn protease
MNRIRIVRIPRALIKPSTILIIFCNVLIFMFMQILLFWYVISKAIENIIIDKSSMISNIIKNSTILQEQLNNYINSDTYIQIYNKSLISNKIREDFNIQLTWQWMLFPFLIVIIIISLGLLFALYAHRCTRDNTLKLDKTDIIILGMVFLSFLTEIIVIFVLIMRYVYVSDMEIIKFFMNSGIIDLPKLKK